MINASAFRKKNEIEQSASTIIASALSSKVNREEKVSYKFDESGLEDMSFVCHFSCKLFPKKKKEPTTSQKKRSSRRYFN